MRNHRPLIFLLILLSIALFLFGVRIGKNIERLDKSYLPPSPPPMPSATPSPFQLQLTTFLSSQCGIKFLYPTFFKEETVASDESRLTYQEDQITVNCQKSAAEQFLKNKQSLLLRNKNTYPMIESMKIKGQKIDVYKANLKNTVIFFLFNPQNSKRILITLPQNLLNLFAETVGFL